MIEVVEIIHPTPEIVTEIGTLMPHLTDSFDGTLDYQRIDSVARSSSCALLIARTFEESNSNNQTARSIVGSAVVSTLFGTLGEKAWLEDFVVAPEAQGTGAAQMIWDESIKWRVARDLTQMRFTSASDKVRAHSFYKRNGCEIIAQGKTALFVHNIESRA